ncbi:uncharacterized protein LOC114941330 [Nylanderia fulva]|uniref:uncharacterized protein LOC114941330 n=1 Tax=Nylanderia fulva TaxID=613905 RepID=UPI0010FADC07|nr:uncharacterized protein LOC114941330 [Nylanderia fulva]
MEEALANQQTGCYSVARALDNFKKIGRSNLTAAKIRSRMTSLQDTWTQCVRNHATLLQLVPDEKQVSIHYFKKETFAFHEDLYQSAMDYMNECLEELVPVVSRETSFNASFAHTDSASLSVKHLPPIKLPPFTGKFEEWETFRDRFQSLIIDNRELLNFSRMHFLVSSLTGSARDAISGIKVTADNFLVAWKALTARFENKRRLIETHISNLYNLPKMTRESAVELHALRDKAEQAISTLQRLNRSPDDIVSDMLVYFLSQKFDPATRRAWKLKTSDNENPPTYKEVLKFILSRALALEELYPRDNDKTKSHAKMTSATATASSNIVCSMCKQSHILSKCPQFVAKSPIQRRELVKKFRRCFNCLSDKHMSINCQSNFTCRTCNKRHHSMIHLDSDSLQQVTNANNTSNANDVINNVPNVTALSSVTMTTAPTPVVLSTAKVNLQAPSGRSLVVRALIDGGSELTFVTERVAQILRLKRIRTLTSTSGISYADTGINEVCSQNASQSQDWKHISNLELADDDPTGSTPIDLIIGSDLYNHVLVHVRNGPLGQPGAIESHFGWILSGTTSIPNHVTQPSHVVTSTLVIPPIEDASRVVQSTQLNQRYSVVVHCCSFENQLSKFWEAEETPQSIEMSPDDEQCEEHFKQTHSRTSDGRYIVRLPFRNGPPIEIGESREIAARRLSSLLRRINNQPAIKQEYSEFMSEYAQLNHMKVIAPVDSVNSQVVYIPHHPVIRETSSTTRLRVVFDASCTISNGTSLNSHMFTGPKLQLNLQSVLLRWQQHKYVYSADIAKMYRQILVDSRDRDYQRILWIDENSNIQEHQLLTVTYGTASAPFLALRVINQLNDDEGSSFPLASAVLSENVYVDDVLFGAEDMPLLKQTRDQVCKLLKRGGFYLRKWASNKPELLSDISSDHHGLAQLKLFETDNNLKVLGIFWNPTHDCFQFQIELPQTLPSTKRTILSTIARIFDPLGWVTPVVLKAKVFMQKLWRHKVGWDDNLSEDLLSQWRVIYKSLPYIKSIKLSRWIGCDSDTKSIELHGFADASQVAYAAVVFLRVTTLSGHTTVSLLAGRSKVAPIKPLTIPRLELSAAVLLARLIEFIRKSLHLPKCQSIVGQIRDDWPTFTRTPIDETHLEEKSCQVHQVNANEPWNLTTRYSWWPKLIRITAYIYRFIRKCRKKHTIGSNNKSQSHALTTVEFNKARNFWLNFIQLELFENELHNLKSNKPLPTHSPILSLNPFLDFDGLICVGRRLEHSSLSFQSKHPILLANHTITTMIIRYTHVVSLHTGLQSTLSKLRQEFWILRARSLVKSVIYKCVPCTREKAQVASQLMGQLPTSRVSAPSRAFLHSGVDYAEPVFTRASAGRGITSRKAYIALFICLATRAIHLELVSDYSTAAFLNAFQRFCARRGLPEVMYSDNGTTFAGADKELSQAYRDAQSDVNFLNFIVSDNITWSFIPPHAPHFGGLWEAGVKSVKYHLRRILGNHTLTFEELTTVLCKVEACLNSRPLCPLTDSIDDFEFLTPGHFLIGSAITINPEPSVLQINENRLSRWQLLRQITERFWKHWHADYINTLQQRTKWRKAKSLIHIGSMVLIQNPLLPPCKWELGRVIHCRPGSDGLIRVVSVKTANSEYTRPITKLCVLPIDVDSDDSIEDQPRVSSN